MEPVQQPADLCIAHTTHEGLSGKHNEDALDVFAWDAGAGRVLSLGVVADGVGGQTAGEIASRVAVDAIKAYFDRQGDAGDVDQHLEQAIQAANAAVYQASQDNPEYEGMSTTVAAAAVLDGRLYTAHVGDSRIYLLRDGRLGQLSTDHTWAQEAIEAGLLTREQARTHPNRNVIRRHLGAPNQVEVDHRLFVETGARPDHAEAQQSAALRPGDVILICSDGLTDMISDRAIRETLDAYPDDLATAAGVLIDKANEAGGRDNITVVLMQVPGATPAADAPAPTPETAAVTASAERPRRAGVAWLLAGALLLLLILAGAAVALMARGDGGAPPATAESLPAGIEATRTAGAPAPAGDMPLSTPVATATATRTPTATPTAAPASGPSAGVTPGSPPPNPP